MFTLFFLGCFHKKVDHHSKILIYKQTGHMLTTWDQNKLTWEIRFLQSIKKHFTFTKSTPHEAYNSKSEL